MKKLYFIFILLLTSVFAEQSDYLIGTKIEIETDKKSVFKIIKCPFYSDLPYTYSEEKKFSFSPDSVGTYIISIDNGEEKTFREFKVFNKEEYKENEIYDIIKELAADNDLLKLREGIKDIFKNNLQKEDTKNYIVKYIYYLTDKEERQSAFELYKNLQAFYKISNSENIEILSKIYNKRDTLRPSTLDIDILTSLVKYDESLCKNLAILKIKLGLEVEESLAFLEKEYEKTLEKEDAKFLADYYLENKNFDKSQKYLLNCDKSRLIVEYYKRGVQENFDFLYDNFLSLTEKSYVNRNRALLKEEGSMESYYKSAMNNLEKERYQLAEMYFKKIINNSVNEELVKKSIYNLAKFYLYDKRFEESLKLFDKYLDEYGDIRSAEALYSTAIIHYNLKNYEKSDKILNRIIETYPLTVWSTKASIYKLQIENKGEKYES